MSRLTALFPSLMLATVSGEDSQDRADRTVLTPWVKFLWEVYRHVLDILKNNNKVEKLYQDMAQLGTHFHLSCFNIFLGPTCMIHTRINIKNVATLVPEGVSIFLIMVNYFKSKHAETREPWHGINYKSHYRCMQCYKI